MAIPILSQTGPQSVANGSFVQPRLDKTGAVVTHEQYGQFGEPTIQGQAFLYTIASQALLIAGTGGGNPTVINPVGSGVIFIPTKLMVSFISGTTVIGAVVIADTLNVGGGAATAAPIKTATLVAPVAALRGAGGVARCQWSPTTNSFTAAQTVNYATSINLGAVAPTGTGTYSHDFNGTLMYYPGTAMSVCYTVTTSTALFAITIAGIELPLPPGT